MTKHIIKLQEDSAAVYARAKADNMRKNKEWLKTPEGKAAVAKRDAEVKKAEERKKKLEKVVISAIQKANKKFFKDHYRGLTIKFGNANTIDKDPSVHYFHGPLNMRRLIVEARDIYYREIFEASPKIEEYFKGDWQAFYSMVHKQGGSNPRNWKYEILTDGRQDWSVHFYNLKK